MKPNRIVNMDFNSTTPMDSEVIDAVKESCNKYWTNPSSSYESGSETKQIIEESRSRVAKMINCRSEEIIFTSGGTEANNWVVYSSVNEFNKNKVKLDGHCRPHIISTNIEHDSITRILEKLVLDDVIEVTSVAVSKVNGFVSADDIVQAIQPNTVLVTVMLANNETGILQPVSKVAELLAAVNTHRSWPKIFFHTDAAQAIGKLKIDINDLGVDYLTIVGHKFYAPRIGALYRRNMCPLHPIFFGGSQEGGLRPGTENTPMIVGLGVAARLVCENIQKYEKHMTSLRNDMETKLVSRFGSLITINGQLTSVYGRLPNTISLTFTQPRLKGQRILNLCEKLRASVGAACHSDESKPSAILIASGIDPSLASCTIRLSLGRESQESEIDLAINELAMAVAAIVDSSEN